MKVSINAEDYIPMVYKLVNEQYGRFKSKFNWEDLFQTGCLGLVKAAKDFEESKGVRFSTYARIKIKGELLNSIAKDKWCLGKNREDRFKAKSPYSLDGFVNEENRTTFMDFLGNEEDISGNLDLKLALNNLPKKLKTIISLKYFYGFKQYEIAEILKISQCSVSKFERKAVFMLREQVEA